MSVMLWCGKSIIYNNCKYPYSTAVWKYVFLFQNKSLHRFNNAVYLESHSGLLPSRFSLHLYLSSFNLRSPLKAEYNQSFSLSINRNHRGFRRVVTSKGLKLELLHKGWVAHSCARRGASTSRGFSRSSSHFQFQAPSRARSLCGCIQQSVSLK